VEVYNSENELVDRIDSRDFQWDDQFVSFDEEEENYRYSFDFFKDHETFIETAAPIGDNWNLILSLGASEADRYIVTAREPFNDQDAFVSFVQGILKDPIDIRCCTYEPTHPTPPLAKKVIMRKI